MMMMMIRGKGIVLVMKMIMETGATVEDYYDDDDGGGSGAWSGGGYVTLACLQNLRALWNGTYKQTTHS